MAGLKGRSGPPGRGADPEARYRRGWVLARAEAAGDVLASAGSRSYLRSLPRGQGMSRYLRQLPLLCPAGTNAAQYALLRACKNASWYFPPSLFFGQQVLLTMI